VLPHVGVEEVDEAGDLGRDRTIAVVRIHAVDPGAGPVHTGVLQRMTYLDEAPDLTPDRPLVLGPGTDARLMIGRDGMRISVRLSVAL